MSATFDLNERPDDDDLIQTIADYISGYQIKSKEAWDIGGVGPRVRQTGHAFVGAFVI